MFLCQQLCLLLLFCCFFAVFELVQQFFHAPGIVNVVDAVSARTGQS